MSVLSRFSSAYLAAFLLCCLSTIIASPAKAAPHCPDGYYANYNGGCTPYGDNGDDDWANWGNWGPPNWGPPNWGPPPNLGTVYRDEGWTGVYLGDELGVQWTNGTWTTENLVSLGVPDALVDAIKDAQATTIADEVYFGYYFETGDEWIAGFEADWAYFNAIMDPGIPGTFGLPGNKAADSVTMRGEWSLSLLGHLGRLINPMTQVYFVVGPSWLHESAAINCTGPGVCGTNGIPPFSQTNSTTQLGFTVGGGVEKKLWGKWRGRIEYRYADYGTWTTSFGTPANLALTTGIKMHTNTLLFGLSYAFGDPTPASPASPMLVKAPPSK